MITIGVKHNVNDTIRMLDDRFRKQVSYAAAVAITSTAKLGQKAVQDDMREKFDRPTRTTIKGVIIKSARKSDLTAKVFIKDYPFSKNPYSLAQILSHQFTGGPRIRKVLETRFEQVGLITGNEYLVPGAGARLDRYGNISRGQIQQIMSQMRVGLDLYAYASNSKRSQRNQDRAGRMFWSRGDKHLQRGVWLRVSKYRLKPVLLVVRRPQYRKLIDMQQIVQRVVDRNFDNEFRKALDNALSTAR